MFEVLRELFSSLAGWFDYPVVKLLSYVVSPILALVSFVYSRRDRRELKEKAEALGTAKAEAVAANQIVVAKQAELDQTQAQVRREQSAVLQLRAELPPSPYGHSSHE